MLMPFLLSVGLAVGMWLLYEGLTSPKPFGQGWRELGAVRDFLVRAGLYDVSPKDFLLFSVGSGLVAGAMAESVLGWPAISVPIGTSTDGLPFGLQLVGKPWDEATLLRAARVVEAGS